MTTTDPVPAAPALRDHVRIGFLAEVEHTGVAGPGESFVPALPGTPVPPVSSRGLADGIELFVRAEELGYDVGYVRSRHLQRTLSAPLLFLTAVGRHTSRMELGTGVIALWFEQPARLAEDLATADLLLGGRLRAGLSSGYSAKVAPYAATYGGAAEPHRERVDRHLVDLLAHLEGQIVATADEHVEDVSPGTPLRVTPQVPGLRGRLAYGAASVARAEWAAHAGLRLQLATLHPDDGSGRGVGAMQAEVIRAYRETSARAGHGDGFVSVTRQMLPVRDEAELERYMTLIPHERAGSAGIGAEHAGTEIGGGAAVFSRVVIDTPEVVAAALLEDPAVQAADELVLALPFHGDRADVRRALEVFAGSVVPLLRG